MHISYFDIYTYICTYIYTYREQTSLRNHQDKGIISVNIALNKASDFGEGGTYLDALDRVVKIEQGVALVHSSSMWHAGEPPPSLEFSYSYSLNHSHTHDTATRTYTHTHTHTHTHAHTHVHTHT